MQLIAPNGDRYHTNSELVNGSDAKSMLIVAIYYDCQDMWKKSFNAT